MVRYMKTVKFKYSWKIE